MYILYLLWHMFSSGIFSFDQEYNSPLDIRTFAPSSTQKGPLMFRLNRLLTHQNNSQQKKVENSLSDSRSNVGACAPIYDYWGACVVL